MTDAPRKPRKMPKNQRAYKTPSGKKIRLVQVEGDELRYLMAHESDIGVPQLYEIQTPTGVMYAANADRMRKWRALRNPPTSRAES